MTSRSVWHSPAALRRTSTSLRLSPGATTVSTASGVWAACNTAARYSMLTLPLRHAACGRGDSAPTGAIGLCLPVARRVTLQGQSETAAAMGFGPDAPAHLLLDDAERAAGAQPRH